jgi:hypothetical protein
VARVHKLRQELQELIVKLPGSDPSELLSVEDFRVLIKKIEIVETALRTDIGVYAVDEFLSLSRPTKHPEIDQQIIVSGQK